MSYQIENSPEIFKKYPESGLFARAILSDNAFVRMTAYRIDLNWALVKYPIIFFNQRRMLASNRLRRILKSKLEPIVKSKLICSLQRQIAKVILLKEKVERYLDKILSKKARLTIMTAGFVIAFICMYIGLMASISKRCGLSKLRTEHKKFMKYAFINIPRDKYIKGLIFFNTLVYVTQVGCCIGSWLGAEPNPHFKHALNSITVGSSLALVSQVKVIDEKISKTKFGPLFNNLTKPGVNMSASTLCGLVFYFSLKSDFSGTVKNVSTEIFLNEVALWKEIREAIPSLPQEIQGHIQIAVRNPIVEHISPKVLALLKQVPETHEVFPLFADEAQKIDYKATLFYCKKAADNLCDKLSNEAIDLIQDLVKKGLVDGAKFKFGGPQNVYRDPSVTGLSMMHLLSSSANLYDDNSLFVNLAEVPDNQDLWNWLRIVKFFLETKTLETKI